MPSEPILREKAQAVIRSDDGPDIALITSIITDANLCLPCIARKTGVSVGQVNSVLLIIARAIRLRIGPHRCGACLEHRGTFSVPTDGHPLASALTQRSA